MNNETLIPNAALLVSLAIARIIEKQLPKMALALERYELTRENSHFVNYTMEDCQFLAEVSSLLKNENGMNHFTSQQIDKIDMLNERFLRLIDEVFYGSELQVIKQGINALLLVETTEKENNTEEAKFANVHLQSFASTEKYCYVCPFCIHSSLGISNTPNDFLCKKLNLTHQRFVCPDIDFRLLCSGDNE